MKKTFVPCLFLVLAAACCKPADNLEKRIQDTLSRMTLEEKVAITHAWKLEPGEFHILIGTSSEDLPFNLPFRVR